MLEITSKRQTICLEYDPVRGLCLTLDGANQFSGATEHRYHESLVLVPLTVVQPRRVFIGGGGDGLAAARLLRFEQIEQIVVCDYDQDVIQLAKEHPDLRELNEDSLNQPRVEVVCADAAAWLRDTEQRFDLIILDFPDPLSEQLGQLYSDEFYAAARKTLEEGGILITQTTMAGDAPTIIANTLGMAFGFVKQWKTHLSDGTVCGFSLASENPVVHQHPVPPWSRYLTDALVKTLGVRAKDELGDTKEVNRLDNPVLFREVMRSDAARVFCRTYPYNQDYLTVSCRATNGAPRKYFWSLLDVLETERPLLVHVDDASTDVAAVLEARGFAPVKRYAHIEFLYHRRFLDSIDAARQRLRRDPIVEVTEFLGLAEDDPDVLELMNQYLDDWSHYFFDTPVNYDVLSSPALYLLARTEGGKAVAIVKVPNWNGVRPEAEVLYGAGTHLQNIAALIHFLHALYDRFHRPVCCDVPNPALERMLLRLGATYCGHHTIYRSDLDQGLQHRIKPGTLTCPESD